MRTFTKAAAFVAVMALVPAVGFAQATKKAAAKTESAAKKTAVSAHTTTGTVKSISDSSLVITKGGKDETFVVNSTTEKKGTVDTGAKVSVHYTMDGKNMVATAIAAAAPKAPKTPKK
jgi:cold shock CspA family protein